MAAPVVAETVVNIAYLRQEIDRPPVLSNLDAVPEDEGIAGAFVGLEDNITTGKFLGQIFMLDIRSVPVGGDLVAAANEILASTDIILIDAPSADMTQIADLEAAKDTLFFNVSNYDNALRDEGCRANLLHTLPSYAMRSDALMQLLQSRRWTDLVMVSGTHEPDIAFANALRRSATKFGLRIRDEKEWVFDANMRRAASAEVPLFTQDFPNHDVMLVADETGDFARYLLFNTWEPVLLAGSEGAQPVAWSPVMEQWGGVQLQNRFEEYAGRSMRSVDYAAFAAIRAIGEAVTRTGSDDASVLRDYILSPEFELGAFKGRPLSFRDWDGQMRQPIPVVHAHAVIAVPPMDGFLHPVNELDTLGIDKPESRCSAFTE
ncbi:MAG: branched-chain amino acid ABC transporter substrate-binding protein [Marivivens sp.]|nr:branched-chain amino acid ABC transporter substrate-binding protein [Marivivens sp.]